MVPVDPDMSQYVCCLFEAQALNLETSKVLGCTVEKTDRYGDIPAVKWVFLSSFAV